MNPEIEENVLAATKSSRVESIEVIQRLWSGYGTLNRINLNDKSVVLKLIKFPDESSHPRGWNTDISHLRKEKSYQVEMNWYESHNDEITYAHTPKLIAKGETEDGQSWILLEDLKEKKFYPAYSVSEIQVEKCLKWLAHFHSHYLNKNPKRLWDIGTYWHLETRPDELAILEDKKLKDAAPLIDQRLNSAKYKTFVHGDAKLANFLFNDSDVAAVDFQYVGGGVGVKDVAYFMSSIFNEDELENQEERCLEIYFNELNNHEVEKEWRELYPWAWCDFYRFLQGWSPGHYKLNTYSEQMKNKVLSWI